MIFESLEKHSPDIAEEWDYERNSPLRPDQVGHGSTKKVFWICAKGHSYEARIDHRTIMHSGCPYCGGKRVIKGQNDLLTVFPDVAAEWDYNKNGDLRPEAITPGSAIKVWWICRTCNNSWQAMVSSRTANAFYHCASLATIDLPASLASVGKGAFSDCTALKTVNYSGTSEQWKAISFEVNNDQLIDAYKG